MKTFNIETNMNSTSHPRTAVRVTQMLVVSVCLVWLALPRAVMGQQTDALQKLELIEEVRTLNGTNSERFGVASALSGDTLVVGNATSLGGSEPNPRPGAAYVFVRQGAEWTLQQTLHGDYAGASEDLFGASVAIEGNTIIVGACHEPVSGRQGAAYVFVRTNTTWGRQAKLVPLPTDKCTPNFGEFGAAVAISGNTVIVGSPTYTTNYSSSMFGAAYVFDRSGSSWSQVRFLIASNPKNGAMFGQAVAVNGDTFAVGAPGHYSSGVPYHGAAYVFNRANNWAETRLPVEQEANAWLGAAMAVSTNAVVVGTASGTTYVFGNPSFVQQQKLIPSNRIGDFIRQDLIGSGFPAAAVAVSGDVIVVGLAGDDQGGVDCGSAYMFVRQGTAWVEKRKFTASDAAAQDWFGMSVAANGDTIVIGAAGDGASGAAYIFAPVYGNATKVANYVRRFLYVPDAAASPLFNPWDAAFLYKYRLYGMGTNAQGVNRLQLQFEHVADYWPGPNEIYRKRSQQAEAELRQGLALSPGSDILGDLLLDIYYDRTVADSLFARDALASADMARFGITNPPLPGHFVIENEIAAYEAVLRTNRMALSNYLFLLRDAADTAFFQRLVPNRGLKPATYLVTNVVDGLPFYQEQSVIGDNTALFTGYKDLVLIAGLLRDYGQTAATLSRLYVARGDTAAATNLIAGTQRFLTLQSSLWRGFFPSLTLPANDTSGLAEALTGINNSVADLEAVKQNLGGLVNPLGFASDFLMFVQSQGSTSGENTFDTLKSYLDPVVSESNPLLTALNELTTLRDSYRKYRESQDEMAQQFSDSSITYNDRLRDIVGVFPDDVRYSNDPTANPGSELDLQYRKVALARNQIARNQIQMDNLVKQVQIEIDKTVAITNITVKYAGKRAEIAEKIGHISAAQGSMNALAQACSPEKLTGLGVFTGALNVGAQIAGEEGKAMLEAQKERLAADEQAEIKGAELEATVKSLLLEMNVLLVDSQEAALTLLQEVNGLQALYREKQDLERKLVQRDNRLSRRYFADPVHRLSVQAGMARANQAFDQAQRWLFFMTRALEYKWNERFQGFTGADGRPWSSASVFQLRNATELQDCYNALCDYDKPKDATTPWGADDWDLFSLRKDAFGYRAGTNAQGQPLRYIVATSAGNSEPLDPTNAFRLRLSQLITNTGSGRELELHFNTARAVGNLFLGPTFTTNLPPTPIVGRYGTYLDKIIEVRIRLAGKHSLPDGEISQVTLRYGGTSYIRNPAVGNYAEDRVDRLQHEATAYSTRFWQYVGPKSTDWIESEALTANAQKVLRSSTPPTTGSGPAIKPVIEFADRSVAASDWTLTIPLEDSPGEANFDIREIDDIEVYFHHRAATRTH